MWCNIHRCQVAMVSDKIYVMWANFGFFWIKCTLFEHQIGGVAENQGQKQLCIMGKDLFFLILLDFEEIPTYQTFLIWPENQYSKFLMILAKLLPCNGVRCRRWPIMHPFQRIRPNEILSIFKSVTYAGFYSKIKKFLRIKLFLNAPKVGIAIAKYRLESHS